MMDMGKRERRGGAGNRRGRAGETLTETLIAMLMIGLASVLFLTMVGASGRIFRRSEAEYDEIYEKIAAADVQGGADVLTEDDGTLVTGTVTVTGTAPGGTSVSTDVKVTWYGQTDYVLSYKVKAG